MSLNGLDGAAVVEAHRAAQADAGGWFLLKYVNRDTVEVLSRGTGGVPEVRGVIEKYEEKSPLYGLVQYRRKKVVLKYVPDGTSRLLQVRLTVQFQSVLETFIPHDTVFSFTTATDLNESSLGLSAMLQPSVTSLTSSSSSLRRRRLNEISEDAEDVAPPVEEVKENTKPNQSPVINFALPTLDEFALPLTPNSTSAFGRHELDELPASAVLAKALLAKRKEEAAAASAALTDIPDSNAVPSQETKPHPPRKESLLASPKLSGSPLLSSLSPILTDKSLPATPEPTPPSTSEGEVPRAPDFDATSNNLLGTTAAVATDPFSPTTPRPQHTRHLSSAESDSISLWSSNVASYSTATPKKKKLAPRPHVEPSSRPKTSGTTDTSTGTRPVANLPASIRINNKSLVSLGLRPGSQQSSRSVPGRFATSSQLSGAPPLPSPSFLTAPYSPTDTRSAILRPSSTTGDAPTATPEKLRLMKALQLRKRNQLMAQRASAASPASSELHTHSTSESSLNMSSSNARLTSIPNQEQLSNIDEDSKLTQSSHTTSPTITTNVSEEPSTKASSFSDKDETSRTCRSLSSATSSSLTPKAQVEESGMKAKDATDIQPASMPSSSIKATQTDCDPVDDMKAALAYLDAAPAMEAKDLVLKGKPQPVEVAEQQHSLPGSVQSAASPVITRRLGPPEPLKLVPNATASVSDVSEDDSLIDEIHNATVHEAKPVSVARTPVTPIMSKGSTDRLREVISKPPTTSHSAGRRSAATTPERGRSASGSVRSISAALPQWPPLPTQSPQLPLTKKATLGTGISKRIKALEVLRTKETSPPRQTTPIRETSAGTSAFSAFMKRSSFLLNQQQSPNASTETSPPKTLPTSGPHYDPHPSKVGKDGQRSSTEVQRHTQKGETISVTARIVRDQSSKGPPLAPSSSYNAPLNLYRSPLIVQHEKHEQPSFGPNSNPPRVKSPTKSERGRFSFASHRSNSHPNLRRSESNNSKASKSATYKRHGPHSVSDAASMGEDKTKSSMTSRLMKRMSNLTTSRSKHQPSVKEEPPQEQMSGGQDYREIIRENSIAESLLHVVDIGDVNIQFPESFLWKRRFMRIDDQGNLIFSPPAADGNVRTSSRKYHLGDFKRPSLPDREREEMAWSIILDLKDGRCIQCACESKKSQQQVLQMLVDAHSAYQQLYGA